MAIVPKPLIDFGAYGNIGSINPTQFSQTGSPFTDPNLFKLYLAQALDTNAFDILFGDEERRDSTIMGGQSIFGSSPTNVSPLFGGISTIDLPSDIGGQNTFFPTVNPSELLIARSNLIGKTVEAVNPSTKQTFSGTVNSVGLENGILLIEVGSTKVPPENLIKVTS